MSADDLVELIKREDHRISRATVYRTLLWMEEAGIARKVDFGEGRFRFEHSYRHPRHFHLICKTCNRSYEFLSSDIEALVEEVAAARAFTPRQSVVQIYGTCEACSTGRAPDETSSNSELLFARDALRVMRVRESATTLARLNMPIDVDSVLLAAASRPGSSIGRPQIAREMLRAGHVQSVQEAFDKWLATGKPAYEPRMGPRPAAPRADRWDRRRA